MKVSALIAALEDFAAKLNAHHKLWSGSLDGVIPEVGRNYEALQEQSNTLARALGALRPYIERFQRHWIMQHPATGVRWDALDAAVGMNAVPIVKGASFKETGQRLQQILGHLSTLDPEDDVPADRAKPLKSGLSSDRIMLAYLDCLHPFIRDACAGLYRDGYFAKAVEESVKAVFQYVRNVTGLSGDGAALAQAAFSTKGGILAFSDLRDATKMNEQVGFMEMLSAYMKGVRHPLAHSQGTTEEAQKGFEFLVMASLFCRRIDDASPKPVAQA